MRELVVRGLFEPLIEPVEIQLKDEFWDLPFSMLDSTDLVILMRPNLLSRANGLGEFARGYPILRDGIGVGRLFDVDNIERPDGNGRGLHELWRYQMFRMTSYA
jgi:hypothetical protein